MDPTAHSSTCTKQQPTIRLVNSWDADQEIPRDGVQMAVTWLPRRCFVTTGSIASFRPLLEEVLTDRFLGALEEHGFTDLDVQCGPDFDWFKTQLGVVAHSSRLKIEAISFADDIHEYMLACRALKGVRRAGVIIGHAGSGTILEALRFECPLIIVPNPTLLNNHQSELAEHCAERDMAVVGRLGHLHEALALSREQAERSNLESLPPYRDPPFPVPETERRTLLDWTLLTCYPAEFNNRLRGDRHPPGPPRSASLEASIDELDQYDIGVSAYAMQRG